MHNAITLDVPNDESAAKHGSATVDMLAGAGELKPPWIGRGVSVGLADQWIGIRDPPAGERPDRTQDPADLKARCRTGAPLEVEFLDLNSPLPSVLAPPASVSVRTRKVRWWWRSAAPQR